MFPVSVVDLILAYLNTPPQVDGLIRRLSDPLTSGNEISGPSWCTDTTSDRAAEEASGRTPRPLHRRLSPDQRAALTTAYVSGTKQKDLAAQYGISISSVKRLVRAARDTGAVVAHPAPTQ